MGRADPVDAPWPFSGPVFFEERDAQSQATAFHVIDRWRYLGGAATQTEAASLVVPGIAGAFELSTYRILQTHLERGLAVSLLGAPASLASSDAATV